MAGLAAGELGGGDLGVCTEWWRGVNLREGGAVQREQKGQDSGREAVPRQHAISLGLVSMIAGGAADGDWGVRFCEEG